MGTPRLQEPDPAREASAVALARALGGGETPLYYLRRLVATIGSETRPDAFARVIAALSQSLHAAVFGSIHLTCADELEYENTEAFRRGVASGLAPRFGCASPAPFRLSTLGGHYQWGALAIAEDHYAQTPSAARFKLMLCKINAHVGVEMKDGMPHFGMFQRGDRPTTCCGAMAGLLAGGQGPFLEHLRRSFEWDGQDRIALLNDADRTAPRERMLRAAVASARLQGRMAAIDCQDHRPATPTLYIVVMSVSLNRQEPATELPVGLYVLDHRSGTPVELYFGLGDDPAAYRVTQGESGLSVEDDELAAARPARAHRRMVVEEWRRRAVSTEIGEETSRLLREAAYTSEDATRALRAALDTLERIAPVPAAITLFGEGVAPVYHVWKARRLALGLAGDAEARVILQDTARRIGTLDRDRAKALARLLAQEYCAH